jgi:hypothetical protein
MSTRTIVRCDACPNESERLAYFEFGEAHFCSDCSRRLTLWQADEIASKLRDLRSPTLMGRTLSGVEVHGFRRAKP